MVAYVLSTSCRHPTIHTSPSLLPSMTLPKTPSPAQNTLTSKYRTLTSKYRTLTNTVQRPITAPELHRAVSPLIPNLLYSFHPHPAPSTSCTDPTALAAPGHHACRTDSSTLEHAAVANKSPYPPCVASCSTLTANCATHPAAEVAVGLTDVLAVHASGCGGAAVL